MIMCVHAEEITLEPCSRAADISSNKEIMDRCARALLSTENKIELGLPMVLVFFDPSPPYAMKQHSAES